MEMQDYEYWDMLIKRSISRFLLLCTLRAKPMHGYEIGKSIRSTCCGCCEPSDAMIYPAIHDLVEGGYIECCTEVVDGRERKVCKLTERGIKACCVAAEAWQKALPYIAEAVDFIKKCEAEKVRPAP